MGTRDTRVGNYVALGTCSASVVVGFRASVANAPVKSKRKAIFQFFGKRFIH